MEDKEMTEETSGMNTLIDEVAEMLNWSQEETRNFLSCFVSDSPDGLEADLIAACEWAKKTEAMAAVVGTMKQSPPGLLEARWLRDSEDVALRINPEIPPGDIKVIHHD
jgi:hypothetical protein